MKTKTLLFVRLFFLVFLSVFGVAFFTTHLAIDPLNATLFSLFFGFCMIVLDVILRKLSLRTFNILLIGMCFGYLFGLVLNLTFNTLMKAININMTPSFYALVTLGLQLFSIYFGMILALRSSHEIQISIPFLKFSETGEKKKDFVVDYSALSDPRLIDLVSSGLFDNALIVPRFLAKEIQNILELDDEDKKHKAKKAQEVLKKLEELPFLNLQYNETDFDDTQDLTTKLTRLARLLDAHLISADISRVQMAQIEGVRIINIHWLSNALKPLMSAGETLRIKIQRQGKEPNQGVGYLEDGTMVVVNGGGELVGKTIDVQVLSVKHTSSGRMVFCNTLEAELVGANA
ncbi:MAG: putative PIN and TRAM-domain containing protein YacL [Chlamydiae bacterium]|nr:putative PIN and TRAM-domain containing protein YacL [Chlamydiota bacterium]